MPNWNSASFLINSWIYHLRIDSDITGHVFCQNLLVMLKRSNKDGLISLSVVKFLTVAFKRSDLKPKFDPSLLMLQSTADGDLLHSVLFLFPRLKSNTLLVFSGGSSANVTANPSNSAKSWSSNRPCNQDVLQIRIDVVLPVPADWHSNACHEGLRDFFMTRYKSEQQFRMSLQGLGTDMWRLEGRVLFNKPCKLRSARRKLKGVLMEWNDGLQPSPSASDAFNNHLAKCLDVKPDAAPFTAAGDTHSWTIVERQAAPAAPPAPIAGAPIAGAGGQAAAAAGQQPPAGAGALAAAPAWAYRPSPCTGRRGRGRGDCAGVACGPCRSTNR